MTLNEPFSHLSEEPDILDQLLAEAAATQTHEKRAAAARKQLSSPHDLATADRDELTRLLAEYEDKYDWAATANVILVHVQSCASCGSAPEYFMGWFQAQSHRRTKGLTRLIAGRDPSSLPVRVERHFKGTYEVCPACAERFVAARGPHQFELVLQ